MIYHPNIPEYKVLTPDGFQNFSGISLMGYKTIIRLEFDNDAWIECTADHKFYINLTTAVAADKLIIGDPLLSMTGPVKLVDRKVLTEQSQYMI